MFYFYLNKEKLLFFDRKNAALTSLTYIHTRNMYTLKKKEKKKNNIYHNRNFRQPYCHSAK